MTECNQSSFGFEASGRREIVARFDGRTTSSDATQIARNVLDEAAGTGDGEQLQRPEKLSKTEVGPPRGRLPNLLMTPGIPTSGEFFNLWTFSPFCANSVYW